MDSDPNWTDVAQVIVLVAQLVIVGVAAFVALHQVRETCGNSNTSHGLEGYRIPRPDLPHHRAEYERLAGEVKAARVAFDAEVAETVRLLDQRAA